MQAVHSAGHTGVHQQRYLYQGEVQVDTILHFGVYECVVWFLALSASIEAAALPQEVSRLQTVQVQAIRLNGGNHLVMWQ